MRAGLMIDAVTPVRTFEPEFNRLTVKYHKRDAVKSFVS